jgi:hypothetical protein
MCPNVSTFTTLLIVLFYEKYNKFSSSCLPFNQGKKEPIFLYSGASYLLILLHTGPYRIRKNFWVGSPVFCVTLPAAINSFPNCEK